ncbi:hypothetical protein [Psychrobacter aestuarii]|uniref:hypothetical protein n=1 Tax=Psychrobacter aestuarii TaxID=556327 RepID=UPI001919F739|nr:hypothetical protein [Psychrobacter aestuarii]
MSNSDGLGDSLSRHKLSDQDIYILDNLVLLIVEHYYSLQRQHYIFYRDVINKWLMQNVYDDTMLYFLDDMPTETMGDIEGQPFRHFLKVINALGFILPGLEQALQVQTLMYIDKLCQANTIEEKNAAILDFWLGIDERKTEGTEDFDKLFSLMDSNHLIKQLDYPEHVDTIQFQRNYIKALQLASAWQRRYIQHKTEVYQTVDYTGQSIAEQTNWSSPPIKNPDNRRCLDFL